MAEEKEKVKSPEAKEIKAPVTFTPDQIELVNKMLDERVKGLSQRQDNPNSPVSLYNMRDPKEIKTVSVSRFEGKWVVGFKNIQTDSFKKHIALYLEYGVDPVRRLNREPYVTLLLSADGKKIEEKKVLLIDYMEYRDKVNVPVIKVNTKEVIHDHGVLGRTGQFAVAIDDKGNPETRPTIMAQSKTIERTFEVKLEGFADTTTFITDFLG